MRLGFLGGWSKAGALIVPGHKASKSYANWPRCAICQKAVHRYGIEEETAKYVEVWAECMGILIDPDTGRAVANMPRKHETKRSSARIEKGIGWSPNRFTDLVARLEFFTDSGNRNFLQTFDINGSRAS